MSILLGAGGQGEKSRAFRSRVASLKRTPKILLRANGRVPLPHKRRHHGASHEYE